MQQQDSCHLSCLAPPSMGNNGEFMEVIAHDTHQDMVMQQTVKVSAGEFTVWFSRVSGKRESPVHV